MHINLRKISENLELSLQLYLLSGLMEVYYSQNFDETYLDDLHLEINTYVKKCYEQLVEGYIRFQSYIEKSKAFTKDESARKQYLDEISQRIEVLKTERDVLLPKLSKILHMANHGQQYYIQTDGNVYFKKMV